MTDLLFVYGTLMRPFRSEITKLLAKNSTFLRTGKTQGLLYDLGSYPGLVYQAALDNWVKGEIIRLHYPERFLPILDDYEMIDPTAPEESEYKRILLPVQTEAGQEECWAYIYQQSTTLYHPIDSGDYLSYFSQNPNHQLFIDKN